MHGRVIPRVLGGCLLTLLASVSTTRAQDPQDQTPQPPHDMSHMDMEMGTPSWTFMQDGVLNGLFNHQGGPRGGNEWKAPNWWMGMLSRPTSRGQLTFTGMFSLDPATVGKRGYGEIFQAGEAIDGRPNVDRQHPHDLFMQVSAAWTQALSDSTSLHLTAAPVGEPALGPAAFMHRASAAAIVFAPLSHHTVDSSHISFGVLMAGLTRGRWTGEASLFNGREPDDNRWDFDLGRLDSIAGRVWFRPNNAWAFQVSSGRLVHPEALESGDVLRTTVSASWTRLQADALSAVTLGYGRNDRAGQQALFGEFTWQRTANTISSRLEILQIENGLLTAGIAPIDTDGHSDHFDTVGAATIGIIRRVGRRLGMEAGLGANATAYVVPVSLQATHGVHPLSFQMFVQIRPHIGGMGPMWNMRMGE